MRKPGRGQILENRLVGPREVLGGGDRRVPAKGRGRTAPCRGRSGASWIWATPLTPARARGSSVRATPSLRPPRILKTSLFLQKGGPRKEPSQRTATALFYLIPCGDFQLSPREFYLTLITLSSARQHSELEARIAAYEVAIQMQTEDQELIALSKESEATKKLHRLDDPLAATFGRKCLLARRMVERGVRSVKLVHDQGQSLGSTRLIWPAACMSCARKIRPAYCRPVNKT